jgi:predicted ATPase
MNRFIITGGPGSGKSTLINQLRGLNYPCSEEASRQLIIELTTSNPAKLPWHDLPAFAELVLERMIALYKNSSDTAITFFDRGIPDIIAYLKAADYPIGENYIKALATHPYHQIAFILPPWKEIYVNDSERWQTFEESVLIYENIKETYLNLNYQLTEVPKLTVKQRIDYMLNFLKDNNQI